jgi:hypothetical protein
VTPPRFFWPFIRRAAVSRQKEIGFSLFCQLAAGSWRLAASILRLMCAGPAAPSYAQSLIGYSIIRNKTNR